MLMSDHSSRRYKATEIALLIVAGVLGFLAFHRLSSYGDDLNTFSRVTYSNGLVEIVDCYLHANGRLGNHLTVGVLRFLLDPWRFGPASFPWWVLFAASYYFVASAALAFGIAFARSTLDHQPRAFFVAALTGLLSLPTVTLFQTVTYAICIVYTAGLWYLALTLRAASVPREPEPRTLGLVALGYVLASLSSEQMLVAAPILLASFSAARWSRRSITARAFLREIAVWAASSVVSALIYVLSPGQQWRNTKLGAHLDGLAAVPGQLPQWYARAVNVAYESLFGPQPWFVAAHTIVIGALTILVVITLINRHRGRPSGDRATGGAIVALALLVASTVCLIHLLVSSHFPEGRAQFFPAFLLAAGLSCTVVVMADLLSEFELMSVSRRSVRVGSVVLFAGVLALVIRRDLPGTADAYRRLVWLDGIRMDVRHRIARLNEQTGKTKFRLSGCVMNLDAPWGFDAWFAWSGRPLTVAPIGLHRRYPGMDASWVAVGCYVPPLVTRDIADSTRPSQRPVRVIHYNGPGPTHTAGWDSDFWVPPRTDVVRIVGHFNPNSAGGPPYRDTLMVRVLFATRWDAARGEAYVEMQPELEGSLLSGSVTSSVAFVYKGALTWTVPLSAFSSEWPDRPFVRVGIRNAIVAQPGWTSDLRLREE